MVAAAAARPPERLGRYEPPPRWRADEAIADALDAQVRPFGRVVAHGSRDGRLGLVARDRLRIHGDPQPVGRVGIRLPQCDPVYQDPADDTVELWPLTVAVDVRTSADPWPQRVDEQLRQA